MTCVWQVDSVARKTQPTMGATAMSAEREQHRRYLAEAEQHLATAEARIASIRARIADLEREGRDVSAARAKLETLEAALELMRHPRGVIARLLHIRDRLNGASRPE